MDVTMTVVADEQIVGEDTSMVLGLESVMLSGAGDARVSGPEIDGAEWRCSTCQEPLYEHDDGTWRTVDGDFRTCRDASGGAHRPERIPLSWLNSVGIEVKEDTDEVRFLLSVGDPRGAFVFSGRRMPNGEIVLHMPDPSDGTPHLPTRWHSIGTQVVVP